MDERPVFIWKDDLTQVIDILRYENAGSISFHDINGAGRDKRDAIKEIVGAYAKGRSIITDYEKRTTDEIIVSGWKFMRSQIKLGVFAN